MQTWAKRGLQSALVTGGLLVLGTGMAAADEKVDPDSPAGPLDVDITVPVEFEGNVVGTPFGEQELPDYHGEISTKEITEPLDKALEPATESMAPVTGAAAPVTSKVETAANAVTERLTPATEQNSDSARQAPAPAQPGEPLRGNRVDLDLTVPIQVTGNAVALGGEASTHSHSTQRYAHHENTVTDGSGMPLAGNAVVLDWALPVQLSGNSVGLAGEAVSSGSASQYVAETGNVSTSGAAGVLSGNVGAAQFATPVQVTGNAIGGLAGQAGSDFEAHTTAEAGGWIRTSGEHGALAGNVVAGPLALPLKGNGNAVSALAGDTETSSTSSADATAGGTRPGLNGIPAYVETTANESVLSGNIVQPQGAAVGNLGGNAAVLVGEAATGIAAGPGARAHHASSSSDVQAGGFASTFGNKAVGSANIVSAPVAAAGEAFGDAAAVIGDAEAQYSSDTEATAGDGTFTTGNGAVLSGTTASTPVALAPEVFGVAGAALGEATALAEEYKNLDAGGYNGTQGNNSVGSGNLIQTPVAGAPELYGIGLAAGGDAEGYATEEKHLDAGGPGNTEDDGAVLSSNLVAAPVALPVQGFGIGGAVLGEGTGVAHSETTAESGGWYHATGVGGSGSGNIVQAPLALPVQLHGIGLAGGGEGLGYATNETEATAGGDASTDGNHGAIAGNIVQAPIGGTVNAFGLGGAVAGQGAGSGSNEVTVDSGGDSTTNGDFGTLAGNVIGPQVMPVVQAFGDAASLAGSATGIAENHTEVTTGGDITTSGDHGSLSGNIFDVPVGVVAQVFGNAATIAGEASGFASNHTTAEVGGETETSGPAQAWSGIDFQAPVGVLAQVYDVSVDLFGQATSAASNATTLRVANEMSELDFVLNDAQLGPNDLPSLPSLRSFAPTQSRGIELPDQDMESAELLDQGPLSGDLFEGRLRDRLDGDLFDGELLDGELLDGDTLTNLPSFGQVNGRSAQPGTLLPTSPLAGNQVSTNVLPNDVLPPEGMLSGELPVDLPSLDGVSITPQAELPAISRLDTAELPVIDGIPGNLPGNTLDIQ